MSYQQFGHVDPEERLHFVEEPEAGDEEPPRRWLPMALIAVGVMGVFAGGLWFAYHEGTKHAAVATGAPPPAASGGSGTAAADNVPLIRAAPEPVKVKPEKAGGMNIPDKDDPLYAMKPGQAVAEHILPPPEAPQPRPVAPPPPPPQAAPAPTPAAFPPPLPAPPQVAPHTAPAPKPTAEAAAKPAAKSTEPAAGGPPVRVQVASLRSPDEARDEWQRLKRENGDLLGRFTANAVKADLGERGIWYRVEVGPVGDKAAAIRLCKALKERDLGCQLVQ